MVNFECSDNFFRGPWIRKALVLRKTYYSMHVIKLKDKSRARIMKNVRQHGSATEKRIMPAFLDQQTVVAVHLLVHRTVVSNG
jgi:hypothetical protein